MRKFLIVFIAMMGLSIQAQKVKEVKNNVSLSGDVVAYCSSPKFDCDSPYLPAGFKWHLNNKVVLKKNFITFHISGPDGTEYANDIWPEGCVIKSIMSKESHLYCVEDSTARYLFIIEKDDHTGYIVLHGSDSFD